MKFKHQTIRNEALIIYANLHPETTLEDIGIAFGYGQKTAKSMAAEILKSSGFRNRVRGMGARSFSPSLKKKLCAGGRVPPNKVSRGKARKYLLDRSLTYAQIAEKLNCHRWTIAFIAKELGLLHGKFGQWPRTTAKASNEQIRAFVRKYPNATVQRIAEKFGYASVKALGRRLVRLGISVQQKKSGGESRIATDKQIFDLHRKNPNLSANQMAKLLGYKSPKSLLPRLYKLKLRATL